MVLISSASFSSHSSRVLAYTFREMRSPLTLTAKQAFLTYFDFLYVLHKRSAVFGKLYGREIFPLLLNKLQKSDIMIKNMKGDINYG